MITPTANECEIVRGLAAQIREIAELPVMHERRMAWYRHNSLQSDRPMVLVFPEGSWRELICDSDLECNHPVLRQFEMGLRQRLFTFSQIGDDQVVEPHFNLYWVVDPGSYGVDVPLTYVHDRGSYTWDPPLGSVLGAAEQLRFRQPSVDELETERRRELAERTFGDLLEVRISGSPWWSLGLTWRVIDLIGLEPLMLAMVDEPDALHRLMAFMRDEHQHFMEWFENHGYLTANNAGQYVGSGGCGYTTELSAKPGEPANLSQMWGFAESQETVGISPDMFAEFVLPYQIPLLDRFGLNCYGCCEPLHSRWHYVRTIPRLRRVSVSPWADQGKMAEQLGRNYIYSRKPKPAPVCIDFDERAIQADLDLTLDVARDCVLEIILKDTHTVEHDRDRFGRWVTMARRTIDRALG